MALEPDGVRTDLARRGHSAHPVELAARQREPRDDPGAAGGLFAGRVRPDAPRPARAKRLAPALPIALSLIVARGERRAIRAPTILASEHERPGAEHQATVTEMGRYADGIPELRDVALAGTAVDYHKPLDEDRGSSLTSRGGTCAVQPGARWWGTAGPMTYLIHSAT
jgi:hypothetical protein